MTTELYGNSANLSIFNKTDEFTSSLHRYKNAATFNNEIISPVVLNTKPFLVSLDRPTLYSKKSSRGPHYVVCIQDGDRITVCDPKQDKTFATTFEHLFYASIVSRLACEEYGWKSREFNGMWLLTH